METKELQMSTRSAPQTQEDFNDYVAAQLRALQAAQEQLRSDTAEIVEILRMAKTFFRVVNWIGRVLKFAIGLAASAYALYSTLKAIK